MTDDETRAILYLLIDATEDGRYPLSPRVQLLRDILMKFGEIGGLPPVIAAPICPAAGTGAGESVRTAKQTQVPKARLGVRQLEGIVTKRLDDPYGPRVRWLKIKNPDYSQKEGRGDLFNRSWQRPAHPAG